MIRVFPPKSEAPAQSRIEQFAFSRSLIAFFSACRQTTMGNESSAPITYGTKLLNDVKVEWKKVEMDAKLPSRDGHCAAAVANKLYVFGGVRWLPDIGEVTESNEILVFDAGKQKLYSYVVLVIEVSVDCRLPFPTRITTDFQTNLI